MCLGSWKTDVAQSGYANSLLLPPCFWARNYIIPINAYITLAKAFFMKRLQTRRQVNTQINTDFLFGHPLEPFGLRDKIVSPAQRNTLNHFKMRTPFT